MKFFKWLFWLIVYVIYPSIIPATKVKLKLPDGKFLGETKKTMKTLRLGKSTTVTAVLNGGYEKSSAKWELSDDQNFTLEVDADNPLKAKVTYNQDADSGVATTVTFKCDADQDEGESETKELVAAGTTLGLGEDATAVELKFEDETAPPIEPTEKNSAETVIGTQAGVDARTETKAAIDLNAPPSESTPPYNYNPPTEPEDANPIQPVDDGTSRR